MDGKDLQVSGKMILDSGRLAASYFERTVIFMVHHDREGAIGLVVNRPTRHKVSEVLQEPTDDSVARAPLHLGGPVQPQALSFLVESRDASSMNVLPWVAWARSLEEVKTLTAAEAPPRVRGFAGYAGWGGGQLEKEFEDGCWITARARPSDIFTESTGALWGEVLARRGGIWRLVAEMPRELERN